VEEPQEMDWLCFWGLETLLKESLPGHHAV
jgi:hypothetical protein